MGLMRGLICLLKTHLITGGLFDISESKQEVAFRYAVERINSNRKILPKSLLSAQIEKIPPQDSFHASKRGMFS
jgi:ionotropic kainate glutamate receptor 2